MSGEELSSAVINMPLYTYFKNVRLKGASTSTRNLVDGNQAKKIVEELCEVAYNGNLERVREIIRNYPVLINQRNSRGQTALYCASRNGSIEVVKELLRVQSINVNALEEHGSTALHGASYGGHAEVISLLLSCGAEASLKNKNGVNAMDEARGEARTVWQLYREGGLVALGANYPVLKMNSAESELQMRAKLLDYLCSEKVHTLSTNARAHLVQHLLKIGFNEFVSEDLLIHVISSVDNKEFMNFKTAVDNISDYFNLYHLYYRSLSEQGKEIFLKKLKSAYDDHKEANMGKELRPIKVMSDIDDTLFSSGGSFGNIDVRFPKEVLYPAVTTFYKELDLGPLHCENGVWPKGRHGNLAFVSARPHMESTRQLELMVYEKLATYFKSGKLHTFPTILCGNVKGLTGAINKNFSEMARKKFKNFEQYLMLYPEYDFVFIGDNGQGDAAVGEKMLKIYPERVKAVFIHLVQKEIKTFGYSNSPEWKKIIFFKNYVEAAHEALRRNLIHYRGLMRIISVARNELEEIKFLNVAQRKKATQGFEEDCKKARHAAEQAAKLNDDIVSGLM